jgi:hypothetical protein
MTMHAPWLTTCLHIRARRGRARLRAAAAGRSGIRTTLRPPVRTPDHLAPIRTTTTRPSRAAAATALRRPIPRIYPRREMETTVRHHNRTMLMWLGVFVLLIGSVPTAMAGVQGYGPGRIGLKILAGHDHEEAGTGGIWNSRDQLHIQIDPADGWRIKEYRLDIGGGDDYCPPLTPTGNPKIGYFDYKEVYPDPFINPDAPEDNCYRRTLTLDLGEDLGFQWGTPWAELRTQGVALFLRLVRLDEDGGEVQQTGAWVVPELIIWEEPDDNEDVVVPPADGDEVVADEVTGEITDKAIQEIRTVTKGKVAVVEHQAAQQNWEVEELEEAVEFEGGRWGWWFRYELGHPQVGHFVDSPVAGLHVETPTYSGDTDVDAKFDFFPGESAELSLNSVVLGSAVCDQQISPLDVFGNSDTGDVRVANLARLLQSLDIDGEPQGGIEITAPVREALEQSLDYWGLREIDFADSDEVENVIARTIEIAAALDPPIELVSVSAEDAVAHLERTVHNTMFRKRVSRTPDLISSKSKLNAADMWFPAFKANGEPAAFINDEGALEEGIPYYDENGDLIRVAAEAKPLVVCFTDADSLTGASDIWGAISRDDGATWKRMNLSRSADRTSFTTEAGDVYYGDAKKPVFQVKGNKILVAWTSKYAHGGKPRYAIDTEDDYIFDDDYAVDDIWGVGGPQRSHNYVEDGYPEVGEVPYSAVWTCRGLIATQTDVDAGIGDYVGDIVWFKPERLTSARRDANQIFCAAATKAGFAIIWQEDPKGVRPGKAEGPGEGWSGATTNHKTDIWYSYVGWGDHSLVDENFVAGGDPEHDIDVATRPKNLVPMSLPMRLSDNDVLNRRNMGLDDSSPAENVSFLPENLTRCVKFEGGATITTPDDPDAYLYDYAVLRAAPEDHYPSMNCVNCHVPYGTEPHNEDTPTQGAPVPLVVLDAENMEYLGGFSNGDCVSCHYSHIVPRDRVVAMPAGLSEEEKCATCEAMGGVWKDGADGTTLVEAYYPYEGYPYIHDEDAYDDGTHRYGEELEGLLSGEFHTFINNSGNETSVAITTDGRLLDGDTGASRPNLFLQPYTFTKPDGTTGTSAWAIVTYEETKGAGDGPPEDNGEEESHSDDYVAEEGKNVIYHSFDFKNPDLVAAGDIVNMPECDTEVIVDEFGNECEVPVLDGDGNIIPKYVVDENGDQILDWQGRPMLAYENARRGRFLLQGVGAVRGTRTIMAIVYKQGEKGHGRPSDIFMQRWVIPEDEIVFSYDSQGRINGVVSVEGNPYRFENITGNWVIDEAAEAGYRASGPVNISSVSPVEVTPSSGDPENDDPWGAVKVVRWAQGEGNLGDLSRTNPYDDARAHRGQLRGDFLTVGFSYTDNWAAARNGHDKYDFYVRRSFNGGADFSTKPAGQGGQGVEHCYTWTYPSGTDSAGTKVEECTFYPAGGFESMRNLSQMKNNFESVIEPRLVATPGTIKVNGQWTGIPEDKQDQNVYYVSWGTSTNPIKDPETQEQDSPHPLDLYYSFTQDKGESYYLELWVVNPDSDGDWAGETVERTPWLAKGDQEQGEAQLRMTPDGSRFYASWLDDGAEGSDIHFRRIMSGRFEGNMATGDQTVTAPEDESSSDDYADNSGGDLD